jgi:hypothetical protein
MSVFEAGTTRKTIGRMREASEKSLMACPMTALPPILSASVPPTNWVTIYPHRNAAGTSPCTDGDQPNSVAMGRTAMLMQIRSMLQRSSVRPVGRTMRQKC